MAAPLYLTPHISLDELTATQAGDRAGLDNHPREWNIRNLTRVAKTLEQVRELLGGVPILISSGYRSPSVNKLVGGTQHSAHLRGLAVDFTAPSFGSPRQICRRLIDQGQAIEWEQLIWEGRWVHLSLADIGNTPRREVLTAEFVRGLPTQYAVGLS